MREVLQLNVSVDDRLENVEACAAFLQTELRPAQWKILCQLAASLVARWESAAAGYRMVVMPALPAEADQAIRSLRLRPTAGE